MARKFEVITELYRRTQKRVTTPTEWQRFLRCACYNFRLSFDEQLLLYAQRPDATAVLPIEGKNGWNERFGRWVNRGATGIAMFDGDHNGASRLKFYYDISDTHPSRDSRPVPIWTVRQEHNEVITEALENSFGEFENKSTLSSALVSAALNAVDDNMNDYLDELKYYVDGSFMEELDELNICVAYRDMLRNSVGYTRMQGSETVSVGEYRGFALSITYDGTTTQYIMTLKGVLSHSFSLGADVFGNITRMDNAIDGLSAKLDAVRDELENTKIQLERARTDMNEPFPREAELAEKTARLKTLNILLNMDQKDKEILDDAPEEDAVEKDKVKSQAR